MTIKTRRLLTATGVLLFGCLYFYFIGNAIFNILLPS